MNQFLIVKKENVKEQILKLREAWGDFTTHKIHRGIRFTPLSLDLNVFPPCCLELSRGRTATGPGESVNSVCGVGGKDRHVCRKSPGAALRERFLHSVFHSMCHFSASCWKTPSSWRGCKSFQCSCPSDKCLGIGKGRGDTLPPLGAKQAISEAWQFFAEMQGSWSLGSRINRRWGDFHSHGGVHREKMRGARSPGRVGALAPWTCSHLSKKSTSKLGQP